MAAAATKKRKPEEFGPPTTKKFKSLLDDDDTKKPRKEGKEMKGVSFADMKEAKSRKEFKDENEQQFFEVASQFPEGLSQDVIKTQLTHIPIQKITDIVNNLSARGRLKIFSDGETILYKVVSAEEVAKFEGLTRMEMVVYQHIEASKKQGLWVKDIRTRTGITQQELTKSLKTLTTRKLIKLINQQGEGAKNRKIYVLYDVEPVKDLSGGPWYANGVFDEDFFSTLRETVIKYLDEHEKTPREVSEWLAKSGVFTVPCGPEDISKVMLSLTFEGILEVSPKAKQLSYRLKPPLPDQVDIYYRKARPLNFKTPFAEIPCARCPVSEVCAEGNVVNPQGCEYYKAWLDF